MNRLAGIAMYDAETNSLVVTRPGESMQRRIRCTNLLPSASKVYGVEINGDAIDVLVGPNSSQRPNRRFRYYFSSLSGGSSYSI
jgi:hypothetical protein